MCDGVDESPPVPMMIGLDVLPDTRYFDKGLVQDVNDLVSSVRNTACRRAPEYVTDENLDLMFDRFGVPDVVSTSCRKLIAEIEAESDRKQTMLRNFSPELSQVMSPILRDSTKLVIKIVNSECFDDQITRKTLKESTKARVRVLCEVGQSTKWLT